MFKNVYKVDYFNSFATKSNFNIEGTLMKSSPDEDGGGGIEQTSNSLGLGISVRQIGEGGGMVWRFIGLGGGIFTASRGAGGGILTASRGLGGGIKMASNGLGGGMDSVSNGFGSGIVCKGTFIEIFKLIEFTFDGWFETVTELVLGTISGMGMLGKGGNIPCRVMFIRCCILEFPLLFGGTNGISILEIPTVLLA